MEKLFKTLIDDAIKLCATDIHFVPVPNQKTLIQMRMNGANSFYKMNLDNTLYGKLLIYMKFISHLDVSERNKAQSGQLIYNNDSDFYLRISTLPISLGLEACAIRLTPKDFTREQINENDMDFQNIRNKMFESEGLFLFTGPTGSGKSTLMYELLFALKREQNKHIITIEDPVEQNLHGIVQVSVNEKANITYQQAFKAILRCDPDVIMIGEIRDEITANHVIQASLSGHLVLSTMHARNNIGAIYRLLELGITREQIKQGVSCIANQRLITSKMGGRIREMSYIFTEEINKIEMSD